jgi:ribonuclease PH
MNNEQSKMDNPRHDGRTFDQLRNIKVTRDFTQAPAGSVLWQQGTTMVLCTASVTPDVPPWFRMDKPGGWVTADYVMLPGSTQRRKDWPKMGHTDSRGTEIQRIIGRTLRAVIDLSKLGPHTIALDCQVLQADGGTRTAAICGAYVALVDALKKLPAELPPGDRRDANLATYDPKGALVDQLAAVSVGLVDGALLLDLDYKDDARASVDMNIAYTKADKLVEVQGSAENGGGFDRGKMLEMIDLATKGCREIMAIQSQALASN